LKTGFNTGRLYPFNAISRTIEAIAKGQNRILLVVATGTGKSFTAFQIVWRLWRSGAKKRILFLADRNILVDQTKTNDFKPFGTAMTKITKRQAGKSKETKEVSNTEYFWEPLYAYSLKQGIEDGFLAPYKVVKIDIDKDLEGWRPQPGEKDKYAIKGEKR